MPHLTNLKKKDYKRYKEMIEQGFAVQVYNNRKKRHVEVSNKKTYSYQPNTYSYQSKIYN